MRVRIAGQEALQANHVRTGFGANQDRTAGASLDQGDATQDQCPHDPFAEFGLFDHEARKFSDGMRSASTSSMAWTSTNAGWPDNCPTSATNSPGPCSTIGVPCPKGSRRVTRTDPLISTHMPGATSPVTNSASPAA